MANGTSEVDLPPGVEISGSQRPQDGQGFEVRWPWPEPWRCERCGHEERAHSEFKRTPQAVRDLDVWGQPSFGIYQAPFPRWARCDSRQHLIPPFKRTDTAYTAAPPRWSPTAWGSRPRRSSGSSSTRGPRIVRSTPNG